MMFLIYTTIRTLVTRVTNRASTSYLRSKRERAEEVEGPRLLRRCLDTYEWTSGSRVSGIGETWEAEGGPPFHVCTIYGPATASDHSASERSV